MYSEDQRTSILCTARITFFASLLSNSMAQRETVKETCVFMERLVIFFCQLYDKKRTNRHSNIISQDCISFITLCAATILSVVGNGDFISAHFIA